MSSETAAETKQTESRAAKVKQEVKAEEDSDDEVPIALLVQQQQQQQQQKIKQEKATPASASASAASASSNGGRTPRAAAVKAAARPVIDDEDSDDDVPIAQLVAKAAGGGAAAAKVKKPSGKAKASDAEAKEASSKKRKISVTRPPAKKSKTTTSKKRMSMKHRTEAFYETDKGEMVQNLLCRWWYAMEWPKESDLQPAPEGYEMLDGYKGVYICTRADNLGHIIDTRNKETAPTFENFSRMPAAELKELLIRAYENQIRELVAHEGPDTRLERQLKVRLSKARKVNPEQTDKKARKLLS